MICQLRSKDDTIKWTDKMTKELENIRNQLKGNPKLYYPSFDNEFSLYSDASAWGLVWYLTQGNGKHEHIITIVYIGVSPPLPPLKNWIFPRIKNKLHELQEQRLLKFFIPNSILPFKSN